MPDTTNQQDQDLGWRPSTSLQEETTIKKPLPGKSKSTGSYAAKSKTGNLFWRIAATLVICMLLFYAAAISPYALQGGLMLLLIYLAGLTGLILLLIRVWRRPQPAFNANDRGSTPMKNDGVILKGIVRGFTPATEMKFSGTPKPVWNFRLECFDDHGNLRNTIPVQMSGDYLQGTIHDGDEVQVYNWKKGELLRTKRVMNLTSGIEVRTVSRRVGRYLVVIIVLLLFFSFVLFMMSMRP